MASVAKQAALTLGLVLACGGGGFLAAAWASQAEQGKVIRVVAQRFVFTPSEITLKKGETVTFEFVTRDILMGFNAPDFATRTDIAPGMATRVTFTPTKTGTFTFLCDVFCGGGHENMNGVIKVVD